LAVAVLGVVVVTTLIQMVPKLLTPGVAAGVAVVTGLTQMVLKLQISADHVLLHELQSKSG
jgi:hypothetical protein